MSPRYFILLCSFVIVNCKTFYANQHLPLSFPYQQPQAPYQQPQAYLPYYTYPKSGYQDEPSQPGDFSDLMRQYQQWQIAIPNQNNGVVWISAPQYGQGAPPGGAPAYPPAPPSQSSSPANSGPPDSTNQHTIVRDTVVPPGPHEDNDTVTIEPTSTTTTTTNSSPTYSSPETSSKPTEPTSTSTTPYTKPPSNESTTPPSSNSTNPLLKYCKEPRGQFADPSDCSKFINCWDDTAFEQSCPSGLVFNPEKHYCDYPQDVNCTSSSSNTTNSTSPTSPPPPGNSTNPKCPSSYGTHRNTSNCAAFYVCVYGEPVDFICPPGTAYNDELEVCDYPYRVDCKGAPYNPAPTEYPSTEESSTNSSPASSSTSPSSTSEEPTSRSTTPPSTSSPTTAPSSTEASSTPSAPVWVPESNQPEGPPPGVNPIALYNLNLKKLPESIVNTNVRCYHQNMLRLTPDCSSVTICQDGLTYIVNCGQSTSFDAYSQRCVPTFRARC